jgi:hypothetical protein
VYNCNAIQMLKMALITVPVYTKATLKVNLLCIGIIFPLYPPAEGGRVVRYI